jgi:acyl-CoA synthetase (AMP-forming)/AMP-acid ligase II
VGVAVPELETRLVNDAGRDVAGGEPGELLIRGDCVFVGYLNRPEATAEVIDSDGWLHTGDVIVEGADGNLRLVGRRKEMFKSGGYNVYPTEVELVISEHPAVADVAVVSAPHPRWDEVGVAFVSPSARTGFDSMALANYARERLANYKVPKTFVVRHHLPRLANGKIDRLALRAEAAGRFAPAD